MSRGTQIVEEQAVSARSALIERLLASQQLSRTARLRDFLKYVATRSIEHPGTAISEQDIGTVVFRKSPGYDTAADNIVRVSAGDLRRRLEHYFLDQGRHESLICEMPRGGYALTFYPRSSPSQEPVDKDLHAVATPVATPPPSALEAANLTTARSQTLTGWKPWFTDRRTLVLLTLLLSLLLAGGYVWFRLTREPWQRTAPLQAIWTGFMLNGSEVEIVLADSSLAITKSVTNAHIGLAEYLGYGYRGLTSDSSLDEHTRGVLAAIFARNIGSISDFKAAQNIAEMTTHSERLVLGSAHDFTPEAIKKKNVILVGSSVSNPWVDLYQDRRSFHLEKDTSGNVAYIRNMQPLPGEPKEYHLSSGDREGGGYSVVAILPNFDPQKRVLIVEGNDSQATLAASDFITSAAGAKAITDRLGSTSLPNHLEVLLRSSKLMATPLQAQIVAVHVKQE